MDMVRKNINRGFKSLRVWKDAVSLYVLAYKMLSKFPFELKKIASNSLDAAHSISRNIAEGYCRRSLKEYLNYLNFALGSSGEFHSCVESFRQSGQIGFEEYDELDRLHYKVENELLKLIESLEKKQWEEWELGKQGKQIGSEGSKGSEGSLLDDRKDPGIRGLES